MKTNTKTVLIIAVTFILGLAVGGLGSQLLFRYRVNRILSQRSPQQVFRFVERVIEPGPQQRQEIRNILDKHGRAVLETQRDNHEKQLAQFQALKEELATVLSPEQMNRLERFLQRRPHPLRQRETRRQNRKRLEHPLD